VKFACYQRKFFSIITATTTTPGLDAAAKAANQTGKGGVVN
jgi:hypothetical protein